MWVPQARRQVGHHPHPHLQRGTGFPGIHGLDRTYKQQSHYLRDMDDPHKKRLPKKQITPDDLQKKIAALEKQLQWEKLRADALDTMINIAEEKLNISIRKKSGSPQSGK